MKITDPYELWTAANAAGEQEAEKANVAPMIVEQHANMADDNSPVVKAWIVDGGPCGFAWINIRPARGPFVAWLKKNGIGSRDNYAGGLTVWCGLYGQSMRRKEAWAYGVAKVLRENGVNAYAHSRMD